MMSIDKQLPDLTPILHAYVARGLCREDMDGMWAMVDAFTEAVTKHQVNKLQVGLALEILKLVDDLLVTEAATEGDEQSHSA